MIDARKFARLIRILAAALFLALAGVTLTPSEVAAQTPAQPDADAGFLGFFRTVELGALVDGYYDYNSNKTDALYRNFDTKHNQFGYSMAEIWLNKVPTADQRAGFKFKLNFGPAASIIHASEPGTEAIFQNIEEGYVSYLAPAGKGLQIDFGQFVTQHGAEVI